MATVSDPTADRLYHPLDRLRGTIRRFVVLDGLLVVGLFLVGWFWAGLAADFGLFKLSGFDWVQDAPRAVRGVALATMLVAAGVILLSRIVRRMNREFSYPALALVLEKRFPKLLGDRLITAVELADVTKAAGYGYSADMIRETIAEAREAVGKVPVSEVFNWHRLRVKAWLLAASALGGLAVCYGLFAATSGTASPFAFAWRFADTATLWGERNLLLRNVPWPRRSYLELVGFPGDELRIGRDAAAPTVRVKAYQWVIADEATRDGWRPLRWADWAQTNYALPYHALFLEGQDKSVDGAIPVDELLTRQLLSPLTQKQVETWLRIWESDPSVTRMVRKLDIPSDVTLSYRGEKTSGTLGLTREPTGEFSAEVAGLKESVRFVVRGADFATTPRQITLVPPPAFVRLTRTEAQPAYLYHPAPAGGSFADLRGLRQVFRDKDVSLTGEKSVVPAVPAGTDVVLTGTADKPLKQVLLTLRQGTAPGAEVGKSIPVPLTGDTFTVSLTGAYRVTRPVEFDLTLVDADDVTATRAVLVQVTDDQGPQVEVAVDVLRKQGNSHLCTPMAYVPFLAESVVRDDVGLSRVEFEYAATRVAADAVVGLRATAVAGVWANAPVVPNLGSAVGPTVSAALATALARGETRTTGKVPVSQFTDDYQALPKETPEALKAKLTAAIDTERPNVVRQIKFQDAVADVFDLERALPELRIKESGEVQPRYRIDLNVVATDTNFETGPKVGQNLEPIRLLVISEQDLLAEISKDEENLIAKLDDVIKRIRQAQAKLAEASDTLLSPVPPPAVIVAWAVRALDVIQDIEKGRDGSQGLVGEYRRLRRELDVNRCNKAVGERIDAKVLAPMDTILRREFPAAEAALAAFQTPLAEGRRPDDPTRAAGRQRVEELLAALGQVRADLGEAVNLNKLRDNLRQIIERQLVVNKVLKDMLTQFQKELFAPSIKPVPVVEVERGQTKSVKHAIDWNVFEGGELKVKVEAPAGVTAPAELTVKDDKNDFEYEITGTAAGEYTLKLVPAVGKAVEVKVVVK